MVKLSYLYGHLLPLHRQPSLPLETCKVAMAPCLASRLSILRTSSATNQSIVALDCEMVGCHTHVSDRPQSYDEQVGVGAKDESVLAQVSIVDYDGKLIYSKYVKAQERVTSALQQSVPELRSCRRQIIERLSPV